jgi:hypothetical protein
LKTQSGAVGFPARAQAGRCEPAYAVVRRAARRDSVARLHQFQGDHPGVRFASPAAGPYSQYTALIPPQTIRGENREITVKSPDLCGLMDQLDDLFTSADPV